MKDPGFRYIDDPNSLPRILEAGDFAEPKVPDVIPGSIYTSLFSAAISYLWTTEQIVVVRLTAERLAGILDKSPCEAEFFDEHKWCDTSGTAYILIKYPGSDIPLERPNTGVTNGAIRNVHGIGSLADYGMSIEQVVRASMTSQGVGGYLMEWNTQKTVDYLQANTDAMGDFKLFNLPVCDLNLVDLPEMPDFGVCDNEVGSSCFNIKMTRPLTLIQCRFIWMTIKACNSQTVNGQAWPYQADVQGPRF